MGEGKIEFLGLLGTMRDLLVWSGWLHGLEIRHGNKINNIAYKSRGLPWTFRTCSSLIVVCPPRGVHRRAGKGAGDGAARAAVRWLHIAHL